MTHTYLLLEQRGGNIFQKWNKLFLDENGQKQQTLPYSLSKSWKKVSFSQMVYPGMLDIIFTPGSNLVMKIQI